MSEQSKKNYNANKAAEKAKRPPKSNAPRPSKTQSGQVHGTNKPSRPPR